MIKKKKKRTNQNPQPKLYCLLYLNIATAMLSDYDNIAIEINFQVGLIERDTLFIHKEKLKAWRNHYYHCLKKVCLFLFLNKEGNKSL